MYETRIESKMTRFEDDSRQSKAFRALLDALLVGFNGNPISEADYHAIVYRLRIYEMAVERNNEKSTRAAAAIELPVLQDVGLPVTYHPCDHMENVRWGFNFTSDDNPYVRANLDAFDHECSNILMMNREHANEE